MANFEKWKDRYDKNWCTKEQLGKLVALGVLTEENYKDITGEEFE